MTKHPIEELFEFCWSNSPPLKLTPDNLPSIQELERIESECKIVLDNISSKLNKGIDKTRALVIQLGGAISKIEYLKKAISNKNIDEIIQFAMNISGTLRTYKPNIKDMIEDIDEILLDEVSA